MTLNAAYALDLQDSCGSITPGKKALFILSKPGVTLDLIPYSLGASWIRQVIPAGI
jgi:imidazolonepropionase-like amidohydrolase